MQNNKFTLSPDGIKYAIFAHLNSLPYEGGYPGNWHETLAEHLYNVLSVAVPIPIPARAPEVEKPDVSMYPSKDDSQYITAMHKYRDGLAAPDKGEGDGTIIQFLLGSHSYNGNWFMGERPPNLAVHWWRKHLLEYVALQSSAPVQPDFEFTEWTAAAGYRLMGDNMWELRNEYSDRYTTSELYSGPYQEYIKSLKK